LPKGHAGQGIVLRQVNNTSMLQAATAPEKNS